MTGQVVQALAALALVTGLAVAALWGWQRLEGRLRAMRSVARDVRLLDALTLGPGNRLAVVAFDDRRLLLAVGKQGVTLIAQAADTIGADA
jgi:flagellar protein FliO/FliZ